jgi:hypothetical protein
MKAGTVNVVARTAGAAVVLGALLVGCSASTKMVHSWTTPEFQAGSVKKIFVVGVTPDQDIRQLYEDVFAVEINRRHVQAGTSYGILLNIDNVDKEAVAASLRKDGFTHVLVSRVVSIQDQETYHPPSTVAVGVGYAGYPGWYGGWYPYMSTSYGYVTSPGYTTVNRAVSLETNVYDLGSEKMIYSGMSETWTSDSRISDMQKAIRAMAYDLDSKRVL